MREHRDRVKDYVSTFTSAHGERTLKDLYRSYCGPSFNSDAMEMARREGRREVVLAIMSIIMQQDKIFELENEE